MIIAVLKEKYPNEKRVALIPRDVSSLVKAGAEVVVESGAGSQSLHEDEEFVSQGARIEGDRQRLLSEADLLLVVRGPGSDPNFAATDLDVLRPGTALVGFLEPLAAPEIMQSLAERRLAAFSMELMPRITRAQSMDALSSMATIAGYRAVLLAAQQSPRMFPLMMTAAGTLTPARLLVLGAGVAGLQAIATARRLGAVVEAYDVRPAVKEQVESLGARFVELKLDAGDAETSGGYAAAQSDEFYRRQRELLAEHLSGSDVVITTAAVPGKQAPILISEEMFTRLRPGSVIIDLAAEKGGNCALTEPGKRVVRNGVAVVGPTNLPSEVPVHASQMYSRNVSTFLGELLKDGSLHLDLENEIVQGTLVAHEGRLVHPAVIEALKGG